MIDDDMLKMASDLKRTLDSSGLKDALRAADEHRKALSAVGDLGTAREVFERRKYLEDYLGIARASEQMSRAFLDLGTAAHTISDSIFGNAAMSAVAAVAKEQIRWLEGISSAGAKIEEFNRFHLDEISKITQAAGHFADWQRQITEIATVKGFDPASFQSRFGAIGRIAEAAEASMRLVRWENIAALDIAPLLKNSLEFRTARLNRSFDAFTEVMARQPEFIVAAPTFVATTPALAVFSHTEALRSISVAREEVEGEEDKSPEHRIWTDARDETSSAIEDLLPRLNPELMTSWKGGWNTADMQSKDWARQASSSFRFVLITTIDAAAPQERVKPDLDPKTIKNDRATRRQQISWLCNSLKSGAYRDMVLADIESAISIIDLFSKAVHEFQQDQIEKIFPQMAVRASVALRHILEIHFNRLNHKR
jgi:hypothetical protein